MAVEEHTRLAVHQGVFRAAEGEDIHAGVAVMRAGEHLRLRRRCKSGRRPVQDHVIAVAKAAISLISSIV